MTTQTRSPATPSVTLSASDLETIVVKAQAPLKAEIQGLRKDVATLTKKVTGEESGMANVGKANKETLANVEEVKNVPHFTNKITGFVECSKGSTRFRKRDGQLAKNLRMIE